jgi:hypothetical protein
VGPRSGEETAGYRRIPAACLNVIGSRPIVIGPSPQNLPAASIPRSSASIWNAPGSPAIV